jgi:hypothetical protein
MSGKVVSPMIFLSGALLVIGSFAVIRYQSHVSKPLGEAPLIEFHPVEFSESEKQHFLDGNFIIIKDVRALPTAVLQTFIEEGGTRPLIANPGEKFEATDYISDSSVPRKRLIIAGVTDGKCFVHYAQGGRALMQVVEFFGAKSTESMQPLWRGYCQGPAENIQDLRRCVSNAESPRE